MSDRVHNPVNTRVNIRVNASNQRSNRIGNLPWWQRWRQGRWMACACVGALLFAWSSSVAAQAGAAPKEHSELDATVQAPFRAAPAQRGTQARTFVVRLAYPDTGRPHAVRWSLTLSGPGPQGAVLRRWAGTEQVGAGGAGERSISLPWDGRADADARERRVQAADGLYQLRLLAVADPGTPQAAQVEQQWQIQVQRGRSAAPRIPAFQAGMRQLSGLDGQAGYRIVYANLHSQTRHSDGGAALDACNGAQEPQTAPFGPIDAYVYAQQHGLDALDRKSVV